jgi:hydroxymethylbilane synthase
MAGGLGTLRVATRRSALAKAQSADVGRRLAALLGQELELVEVTTVGDLDSSPLSQIGGTGVFVTAVRQAVLDGAADVAVHSLKDLPTTPDARLVLAAVPAREDPRDVLVSRGGATLADLPPGARVGTGSPRRRAQLAVARPDLEILDLRGNVDTRLARVLGGPGAPPPDLDAIVLAAAGLARLGRSEVISEHLDPDLFVPAPGQGALAVEVAAGSELASRARASTTPPRGRRCRPSAACAPPSRPGARLPWEPWARCATPPTARPASPAGTAPCTCAPSSPPRTAPYGSARQQDQWPPPGASAPAWPPSSSTMTRTSRQPARPPIEGN